ncbi:MAG: ribose-5-phosphate isomerase RpiA [Gammaproteobacteria bacterium]|nr:ribose-5-phosphate isomerase RpiA [Gammaproteobacteria bacterium]
MDQAAKKQAVAAAAIEDIRGQFVSGAIIGVGTGSTANAFIDLLAQHKQQFDGAVASSQATADRLSSHGIRVLDLNDAGTLAVYVDGADEADPDLNLIKGGGGALTREKIVAAASERFVCIVDDSKCVATLGDYPLPIEVLPMARELVMRALVALGGQPKVREGFTTDNGNLIVDTAALDLRDPPAMERALNDLVGAVCNGLFALRPADALLVAGTSGVANYMRGDR